MEPRSATPVPYRRHCLRQRDGLGDVMTVATCQRDRERDAEASVIRWRLLPVLPRSIR